MTHNDTQTLLRQAIEYGCEYLAGIDQRPVYPDAAALDGLAAFDEDLPEQPTPAADVLRQLHEIGSPATTANMGGRYFGYVNGGSLPAALAARVLADCWDQNAALEAMSPRGFAAGIHLRALDGRLAAFAIRERRWICQRHIDGDALRLAGGTQRLAFAGGLG